MDENMKNLYVSLAEDAHIVSGFTKFVNNTDRARYFGYVDKKELKQLCRYLKYTDTRSFVKGGIVTAAAIGLYNLYRKSKETKPEEKVIEVEAEDID